MFSDNIWCYILEENIDNTSSGGKSDLWGKLFVTMISTYTCIDGLSTTMQKNRSIAREIIDLRDLFVVRTNTQARCKNEYVRNS
jgi:hypothetical protein